MISLDEIEAFKEEYMDKERKKTIIALAEPLTRSGIFKESELLDVAQNYVRALLDDRFPDLDAASAMTALHVTFGVSFQIERESGVPEEHADNIAIIAFAREMVKRLEEELDE